MVQQRSSHRLGALDFEDSVQGGRTCQRHQPGSSTCSTQGSHRCGAGQSDRAGHHQHPSGVTLVRIRSAHGQCLRHLRGFGEPCVVLRALDSIADKTDICYPYLATQVAARIHIQPGLGQPQRDSDAGRRRWPQQRSGVGVQAGGEVHRHDRAIPGGHHAQHIGHSPTHRPAQTGAQYRVHHDIGAAEQILHEGIIGLLMYQHCAFGGAGIVGRGISSQVLGLREQDDLHLIAMLQQVPRRHQTIATVVALAREDDCAAGRGQQLHGRISHRNSGIFHQLQAGDAVLLDGDTVYLPHLGGCNQSHQTSPIRRSFPATSRAASTAPA